MLLAIDIGNTQTVLGLFAGTELCYTWRLASEASRTVDELRVTVLQLFDEVARNQQAALPSVPLPPGQTPPPVIAIERTIIASVVPALTFAWKECARSLTLSAARNEPIVVGADYTQDLTAHLQNPSEVGADRIANAVAAKALYGAPAIVLDFGTATNIDVIDAQGRYLGGIISAGVQTAADALFETAARLPAIDLKLPPQILGTTTKTAVQSGILYGEAAKMDGLLRCLQIEQPSLAGAHVPIIATGGMAPLIAPMIPLVTHFDEHLTLRGLALIAQRLRLAAGTASVGTGGRERPCVT